jgi:hypothetical protein
VGSFKLHKQMRRNYYEGLSADYSRPGLVSDAKKAELIAMGQQFVTMREDAELPAIDEGYTREQIEQENKEWWPTHCEALRQGRGDILTEEYRKDLVYHCGDGPYFGIEQQQQREKHWWAIIAQPGVTMCWPIVQFWGEFTHFEWQCLDDASGETIAKGSVCWVRRGHRGGCYYKSEQLTFVRDVFASQDLLNLIKV